jgi:hypothetical protein
MCCSEKADGSAHCVRDSASARFVRLAYVVLSSCVAHDVLANDVDSALGGVVAPYRVHVLEVHEGDEPDAAVDRDSLRPGDVVVARRVGSRGYRARQRHQREQRRSRQLGDGRCAGPGRAHRASRPGARGPITHPPGALLSSSPSVPSLGEASGTDAWGAPRRAPARVEAPGYVRGTYSAIGA